MIDYTRKKKEDSLPESTIPGNNDDDEKGQSNIDEIAECLYQLIEEYDEREQKILIKVFQKSLTQKEVAQYLDIPYSTLKSRVQKARKQIIKEFNERCCRLKYDQKGKIIGCG